MSKSKTADYLRRTCVNPDTARSRADGRLSYMMGSIQSPGRISALDLVKSWPKGMTIFCDSGFFSPHVEVAFHEALLSGGFRLILTERMRDEIQPWLDRYPEHPSARAITGIESPFEIFKDSTGSKVTDEALVYYANLLYLRRKVIEASEFIFEKENGRPPNTEELAKIKSELHNEKLGARGFQLAKKGHEDRSNPNRHNDDALVVRAVFHSIINGTRTLILTRDFDIEEQLYKLFWLMELHYRGLHLARYYKLNESAIQKMPLPLDYPQVRECFPDSGDVLVGLNAAQIDDLLPRTYEMTNVLCLVLKDEVYTSSAVFEKEMHSLIEMKGRTKGSNTDLLGDNNCHAWSGPLPLAGILRAKPIIARDSRSYLGYPHFDLQQSVFSGERVERR